jgi:MFS-type transporter involved in bile tolerance (Atg22 family)
MTHEIVSLLYRAITLIVLGCVVWSALDRKIDLRFQLMAIILTIPLALRVLMIK